MFITVSINFRLLIQIRCKVNTSINIFAYGAEAKSNKMKIDFDHWQGVQIAETEMATLNTKQDLQLVAMLKPEFNKDGNMYCFTYPSRKGLPNDCIQGFGETPLKAAQDFNNNFFNEKAVDMSVGPY